MASRDAVSLAHLGPKARAQANAQIGASKKPEAKPNKFHAKRTPFRSTQGFELVAASKREARDYAFLDGMIQTGKVIRWVPQVAFRLPGNLRYICDSLVWWSDHHVTVRDVKGVVTPAFRDRQRLMISTYNLVIEIVR